MENTVSNSANSANQPPGAVESGNALARARRFTEATIESVATLCARQLNQSEACRQLGINPKRFFSWVSRCRRNEKFAAVLERLRGQRIDTLIGRIEKSAAGADVKPDWRAAETLLRYVDRERFGQEQGPGVSVTVNATGAEDVLRLLGKAYQAGQQQLPDAKPAAAVIEAPADARLLPEKSES